MNLDVRKKFFINVLARYIFINPFYEFQRLIIQNTFHFADYLLKKVLLAK
jgi:hypothetical protein